MASLAKGGLLLMPPPACVVACSASDAFVLLLACLLCFYGLLWPHGISFGHRPAYTCVCTHVYAHYALYICRGATVEHIRDRSAGAVICIMSTRRAFGNSALPHPSNSNWLKASLQPASSLISTHYSSSMISNTHCCHVLCFGGCHAPFWNPGRQARLCCSFMQLLPASFCFTVSRFEHG